jgi:DNA-directed RNA polymerase subunit RPC12/RpoP
MKKFQYKYKVEDIITNVNSGKLQILEQIRVKSGKWKIKGYRYRCLICGNEDIINEYSLKNHVGCNVCSNQKVLKGYNDVATTNQYLASLFANKEDTYKYTEHSGLKVDFICPDCGNLIKNKTIFKINKRGLSCPKCSEKFVFNILQQLKIDFVYQLTSKNFKWCDKYKYDFYFKINNKEYIIETNGIGHYEKGFDTCGGKTLKEEKENDKLKKELAINNGILEENYIIIDCRYSTLDWIKEHALSSKLNELFDLSKVIWLECHKYACSGLVKKVCELWESGIHSTIKIREILKLTRTTIRKYLKQGAKNNWCDYNPKEELIKSGKNQSKKNVKEVICLNNNEKFNSLKEASAYYNINRDNISECCRGKRKYCRKDHVTKERLYWMYYEDYLKLNIKNK